MMKKLLTAVFAVAALVLVTPSAEARRSRCGKTCAPKRCEQAPACEAPKCTTEIVDYKLYPCCRVRTYTENGYKKCPVKRTCCESVKCCPNEMSCCLYEGQEGFVASELAAAHGGSEKPSMDRAGVAADIAE